MILRSKILTLAIITATAAPCALHGGEIRVPDAVYKAWGSPVYNSQPWTKTKDENGNVDESFFVMPQKTVDSKPTDSVAMIYAARKIVEHGGYFCTTQVRAAVHPDTDVYTAYIQPTGQVGLTCFWLCEPGYTGTDCAKINDSTIFDECGATRMSKETVTNEINYYYDQDGSDAEARSIEWDMYAEGGFLVFEVSPDTPKDESDIVLAAQKFLENGHGIVASVAMVSAHPGFEVWSQPDDTWKNSWNNKGYIMVSAVGSSYISKTLCMPGFGGSDCSKPLCPFITKQELYDCWPNGVAKFNACAKPKCEDDTSVKCVIGLNRIGKKTCKNKKWGKCEELKN